MASVSIIHDTARKELFEKYRDKIEVNSALDRSLVSYQSNRNRPYYRWFKYKEGFSAALVEYVLERLRIPRGRIFDPFAGSGAALLAAREHGWDGVGIELLPVGIKAMQARLAAECVTKAVFREAVDDFCAGMWRRAGASKSPIRHLKITRGAFPEQTEHDLAQFREYLCVRVTNEGVRQLLELACLNVLESLSYTRKDGQYLRWDERAPRDLRGKRFNKGTIHSFDSAMQSQLRMMLSDMAGGDLFSRTVSRDHGMISLIQGSCLDTLPTISSRDFDLVMTSPPYCNRYDYTRTYALELAYLGVDEQELRRLRQDLLSCTVENRSKIDSLRRQYADRGQTNLFQSALRAFEQQAALQESLGILDQKGRDGSLNNANLPRMVRNYFVEMTIVIFELARVVKAGGRVVMVNDNVQYAGEEVPVDLILCDLAADAGFVTECIWTLGRGKGNSSQQMGIHGRNELRKCAYVWRMS